MSKGTDQDDFVWDKDEHRYRKLDPSKIVQTADLLARRVKERFPSSGLSQVSNELRHMAREAAKTSISLGRPFVFLRLMMLVLIGGIIGGTLFIFIRGQSQFGWEQATDFQLMEAIIQDLIFIALAVYFIATLESRIKRRKALGSLHSLRSLAHIIDMHQLTKDPETIVSKGRRTASSPQRNMDLHDLQRYFDYCSEMLSITSKLAALQVQGFDDPVTLSAVNELENLTTGLSRKIWQKIMIASQIMKQPDSVS